MAKVDAVEVIKFVQLQVAEAKREYKAGKITLVELQRTAKRLNQIADFTVMMSRQNGEQNG